MSQRKTWILGIMLGSSLWGCGRSKPDGWIGQGSKAFPKQMDSFTAPAAQKPAETPAAPASASASDRTATATQRYKITFVTPDPAPSATATAGQYRVQVIRAHDLATGSMLVYREQIDALLTSCGKPAGNPTGLIDCTFESESTSPDNALLPVILRAVNLPSKPAAQPTPPAAASTPPAPAPAAATPPVTTPPPVVPPPAPTTPPPMPAPTPPTMHVLTIERIRRVPRDRQRNPRHPEARYQVTVTLDRVLPAMQTTVPYRWLMPLLKAAGETRTQSLVGTEHLNIPYGDAANALHFASVRSQNGGSYTPPTSEEVYQEFLQSFGEFKCPNVTMWDQGSVANSIAARWFSGTDPLAPFAKELLALGTVSFSSPPVSQSDRVSFVLSQDNRKLEISIEKTAPFVTCKKPKAARPTRKTRPRSR